MSANTYNEMDPIDSHTGPQGYPGQPTSTTHTTTTTTTSRGSNPIQNTAGHTHVGTSGGMTSGTSGERFVSGEGMGGKVKGIAAAVHGMGETVRGAFNSGVDQVAGDQNGLAKNKAVEEKGLGEVRERNFHPVGTSQVVGNSNVVGGSVYGRDSAVPGGASATAGNPRADGTMDASMGRDL